MSYHTISICVYKTRRHENTNKKIENQPSHLVSRYENKIVF